jgi:EAL domain-containing protein (putative c-di-GMP-specific phosphodiesterase class I)
MYIAKKMTNGYAVYDSNLDQHTPRRLALMTELSDAIKDNQLILYYQPIINVKGHSIRSVEALIRWQHPKQGMIPSDQFIPDAENSELIKPITEWVLNEALAQCRVWQDSGLDIKVSVNISSRNLLDSELPNKIGILLKKHGIQPDMLELEITESAIILDPDRCFDTLMRASAVGCPIAVDDFGTGYSSLAYLKSLPVSSLKIDCSFVTDMEKDENDAVIVRSIIDLAHNLGLNVIAEGVENQGVLNLLEILGCDQAQGYFISRPVSADKLGLWLKSFSARTKRRAI